MTLCGPGRVGVTDWQIAHCALREKRLEWYEADWGEGSESRCYRQDTEQEGENG